MATFLKFKSDLLRPVRLETLLQDARGAAAVEFGMLAGAMVLLICFWAEIGVTLFMQSQLDGAVRKEARLIRTGAVGASDAAAFKSSLCADVQALMGCSGIQVNVASASSFSSLSSAVPTDGASRMTETGFAPGGSGQDVIVQVGYTRNLFFPLLKSILGKNGTLLIVSSVAFQNEPY